MRAPEIDCVGTVKLMSVLRAAKAYAGVSPKLKIGGQLDFLEKYGHCVRVKREEELCGME